MISKKLEVALNEQISLEAQASFQYLAMASWCEQQALNGCAKFFYKQSNEERQHMMKIFHYLNSVNGHAIVPTIDKTQLKFKDVKDVVENALKGEQKVTAAVHKLSELTSTEKDYATYNFVQFYVNEQREEEVLFTQILEKIELIGMDGMGLYYIDKELESFSLMPAQEEQL